jgi:anti-sigma factor RsiW
MADHPISHPSDRTLSSYGLGKLDDTSSKLVNQHLESCPECRLRVAELSSDTFLCRLRDAQAHSRPNSSAPAMSATDGLSMLVGGDHSKGAPPPASSPASPAETPVFRPTGWRQRYFDGRGRVRADRKPGQARRMTVFEKHATLVVDAAQVALAFSLLVRGTGLQEDVPMPFVTPDTVLQIYQVVPMSRSLGSELLGPALQQHVAPGCQSSDRRADH